VQRGEVRRRITAESGSAEQQIDLIWDRAANRGELIYRPGRDLARRRINRANFFFILESNTRPYDANKWTASERSDELAFIGLR
jgi:hypothetical protein